MVEIWKPVVGYENLYEVSNLGWVRGIRGRVLKPQSIGNNDYVAVYLYKDGKRKTRTIHSLVAESFIGPCPKGKEVCHCDGRGDNNLVSNLRYDTHRANMEDRKQHRSYSSKFPGVYQNKRGKWRAYIWKSGRQKCLGSYDTELEARDVANKERQSI